jgi:predicted DsbA family dithiol-disulfide isomerase
VAKLPKDVKLSVHWRPFELNPNLPPEGLDRIAQPNRRASAVIAAKAGSFEQIDRA